MSLSNRFTHPFERWMNNIVRRELGSWRGPSKSKSGSSKSISRPHDWTQSQEMAPWGQWRWTEPWSEPWSEFSEEWPSWKSSPSWVSEMANMSLGVQSHINDKGQLELKAKVPQGIKEEDIHLDFEDGGLRLHATKSEEHTRKLHGTKGSSSHKTHFSVSHFWPLDKSVSESDVTANFNSDDHLLEITINNPQMLEERPKTTPITIGSSKSYQSLDEGKRAREVIQESSPIDSEAVASKIKDTASKASSKAKDLASDAAESAKDAKDATLDAVKSAGTKTKEFVQDATESAKSMAGSAKSSLKKGQPISGPDAPQAPSLDEM